jgi:hypothetical protein
MSMPFTRIAGLVVATLLLIAPVHAQSPSPDAEAAARELVDTMKLPDQFKAVLPTIIQHLKPAIVQNRPEVGRDFDAMMPVVQEKMAARLGELSNAMAAVYASNFTAAGLLQKPDRSETSAEDAGYRRANHGRGSKIRTGGGRRRAETDDGRITQQGPRPLR